MTVVESSYPFTYTVDSSNDVTITGCTDSPCPASLKIPTSVGGNPVKYIADAAFKDASTLTSITLPSSLLQIGVYAFENSGLVSINVPSGVTSIGAYSFAGITSLASATLPDSLTSMGNYTFTGDTGLSSVTLGTGLTTIPTAAFRDTSSLASITIPSGVTGLGTSSFQSSGLTSITLPNTVTNLGYYAFKNNSSLASVILSNSLTTINPGTFQGDTSLAEITIPASVTQISNSSFYSASSLAHVRFQGGAPAVGPTAFNGVASGAEADLDSSSLTGYGADGDDFHNLLVVYPVPYTYTVTSNQVAITGCVGGVLSCPSNVNIPAKIGGRSVVEIYDGAFQGATGVTSVTLPSGVTTIGNSSFRSMTSLENVSLPSSLTQIGNYAFNNDTSLSDINLPDSLTTIGVGAFTYDSAITSLSLPSSVSQIGNGAFARMTGLASINIPEGITEIGSMTFFLDSSLANITLPSSLTTIGNNAFSYMSGLTSITLPSGVQSIGDRAFNGDSSLAHVHFQGNAPTVGFETFKDLPAGAQANPSSSSLTDYGDEGDDFYGLIVHYIPPFTYTIADNKATITGCTDSPCPSTLTIPSTVEGADITQIADSAFKDASTLTSISLPSSLRQVGDSAFQGSGLVNVTIPEGVTDIGDSAFADNSAMLEIFFPSTLTSIGTHAFRSNSLLATVHFSADAPTVGNDAFSGVADGAKAVIDSWNHSGYGNDESLWHDLVVSYPLQVTYQTHSNYVEVIGCIDNPCPAALHVPSNIEGKPVTIIQNNAFQNAESITSASLPTSLTSIGSSAFQGASGLTSVTIPAGVTSIGAGSFAGTSSLTSISLPNTLTTIGLSAFDGASSLTNITLPESLTNLGAGAFWHASSLTSIVIPEGINQIQDWTFAGDTSLNSITLPSSLNSIGVYAFNGATSLTSITLPSSLTYLDDLAFYGASNLVDFNFQGNAPTVGTDPFQGVAEGAKANLSSPTLTGFGYDGELWHGLIVTGGPHPAPPSLTSKPNASTAETAAQFTWVGSDEYQCKLDESSWADCSSPKTYSGLSFGSHTFKLRIKGGTETTDYTWTITAAPDLTPPTLTSKPSTSTTATNARFTWNGSSSYQCQLDLGTWENCSSPKNYSGLSVGSHSFKVRVRGGDNSTDYAWTVNRPAPQKPLLSLIGVTGNGRVVQGTKQVAVRLKSQAAGAYSIQVKKGAKVMEQMSGTILVGSNKLIIPTKKFLQGKYLVTVTLAPRLLRQHHGQAHTSKVLSQALSFKLVIVAKPRFTG
jgi:hypothetical protein